MSSASPFLRSGMATSGMATSAMAASGIGCIGDDDVGLAAVGPGPVGLGKLDQLLSARGQHGQQQEERATLECLHVTCSPH